MYSDTNNAESSSNSEENVLGLTRNVHALKVDSSFASSLQTAERLEIAAPAPSSVDLSDVATKSFIAAGDEFVGDINCKGGLKVCGTIRGSVNCSNGTVYVEYGGTVTGSIESAADIYIDGAVGSEADTEHPAKIRTYGKLTLMNRCVVNADVLYGKLASEDDMTLNGSARKLTKNNG